ncbi:MAG: InlB B-repeat-containing protein [Paludibacteraceae bacterium]|nr:InlB B-repeat-containing protein [Paludibacteraceae bacterium]
MNYKTFSKMKNFKSIMALLVLTVFSVNVWGATYTKVTSLKAGDEIVLVCEATNNELTSISTTSTKYGIGTNYETSIAGEYVLEVVAGSETNSFSFKTGSNYLRWNSGNSLDVVATSVAKNSSWFVTFDTNGNATIKNANDENRVIWWNVSSPRFACYTGKSDGSDYKYVQLYKKEPDCNAPTTPLSISASQTEIALNKTATITPTVGNGGAITYKVTPSTGKVENGVFSATATGTYKVTAHQDLTNGYCAQDDDVTITVGAIQYGNYVTQCCTSWDAPTVSYDTPLNAGGAGVAPSITGTTHGTASYESSNTAVLTVDADGTIHPQGAGTAFITVTWAASKEGDVDYCENQAVSNTITVNGNISVAFDAKGGEGEMTNQSMPSNTATNLKKCTFTKTGYTFLGWDTDPAGATVVYEDEAQVTLSEGCTLYAVWQVNAYTVTFTPSIDGNSFTVNGNSTGSVNVNYNATVIVIMTGKTHFSPATLTYQVGEQEAVDILATKTFNMPAGNVTLSYSFAEDAYKTITFLNNGTQVGDSRKVYVGEAIGELPTSDDVEPCDETSTTFIGWTATEITDKTDEQPDMLETTTVITSESETTYFALWAEGEQGSADVTHTMDVPQSGSALSGYAPRNFLDDQSAAWQGVFSGFDNSGEKFWSVKNHADNYYIQSPEFEGNVKSVTIYARQTASETRNIIFRSDNTTHQPTVSDMGIKKAVTTNPEVQEVVITPTESQKFSQFYLYTEGMGFRKFVVVVEGTAASYSNFITTCCTPLDELTLNAPTDVSYTGATINWNTVTDAAYYEVRLGDGEWTSVGTATSHTFTALTPGTLYNYSVRAKGDDSHCDYSNVANGSFTTTANTLNSIAVTTDPTSLNYVQNETFRPDGLVITATYSFGDPVDVAYSEHAADFSFNQSTLSETGEQTIQVTYGGQTVDITVNVYTLTVNQTVNGEQYIGDNVTIDGAHVTATAPNEHYTYDKYTIEGASGRKVTNKTEWNINTVTGNVVMTIKWNKDASYLVQFSSANTLIPSMNQDVYSGESVILPDYDAEKMAYCENNGYETFLGWSKTPFTQTATAPTGDNLIPAGTSVAITDNTTFYAVWAKLNGEPKYIQVTEAPETNWNGKYLVIAKVADDDYRCFNGSLAGSELNGNSGVTLQKEADGTYAVTADNNSYALTLTANNDGTYSVKTASGYYITGSQAENSNGFKFSATDDFKNTISINEDGQVTIADNANNGLRFYSDLNTKTWRFYKPGSGIAASIYRYTEPDPISWLTDCRPVVTFSYMQDDDITTDDVVTDEGKVSHADPASCSEVRVFMGWSRTNQTTPVEEDSKPEFVDLATEEFTEPTTLYAIYASINGGKITGEQTLEDDMSIKSEAEKVTISSTEYKGIKLNAIEGGTSFTTAKIKDLKSISFDYITNGAAIGYYVMISTNGSEWTKITADNVTLLSDNTTTHILDAIELTQGDYYVKFGVTQHSTAGKYAIITKMSYTTATRAVWYSDYSTDCTMASEATISYVLDKSVTSYATYEGANVGQAKTINDYAPQGYHLYSLTIKGTKYELGDDYILSHSVRADAADVRPIITWKERYSASEPWNTTTAPDENGKLVLPATQPASFAENLYVFDGWTATVFDTDYKTTAPTYVTAETDAPATPTTYYAVYKKVNAGGTGYIYRQTTPSPLYKLIYSPNGGDGTDYITYTDLTTATTPADDLFTRTGSTLVGWTLDKDAEDMVVVGTSTQISEIDGDRHYYAVWIGELTLDAPVALTSAKDVTVGSSVIKLESQSLGTVTHLRFSYKDIDNDIIYSGTSGETSRSHSEFRVCNTSYNIEDNNWDVRYVSGSYNHEFTITYSPKDGNKISHYQLIIELLNNSKVMATQKFDLLGRSLPDQFVIAEYRDKQWYALQANMTESKAWAGVPIEVQDGMAMASDTLLYSLRTYNEDKNKVLFQSAYKQGHLWASANDNHGIRNWATSVSGANDPYAWILNLTDSTGFATYTMGNVNNNFTLAMYGADFGMYASYGTNVVYFLPVAEPHTLAVDEWYSNKILFHVPFKLSDITLTINGETRDDDIEVFSRRANTTALDYNLYELGGSAFDLVAATGQTLVMQMTTADKKYISVLTVPAIITSAANASDLTDNADVIVRDGGVLTVDASKALGNLAIYPSSKVVVPEEINLTVDSLIFFGGIDEIAGIENKYGVPQLSLKGTLTNAAETILYRMRVDGEQMYQVSFPYDVAVADITREDALDNDAWAKIGRNGGTIILETYNGDSRANGHRRDTQDASTWTDITSGTLTAGIGYTVAAQPRFKKYPYVILDFPMVANFSEAATEGTKSASVTAHESTGKYDWGWNLMANPYMAGLKGAKSIMVGETEYDFVYIPTDDGEDFYQGPVVNTELLPFKHFFLQVATGGTMNFALANRQNAPRRMMATDGRSAKFSIRLTGNEQTDITYFKVADTFTAEYDIPGDNAKMFGATAATKVYTLVGDKQDELAQIAISADQVKDLIPMGYKAPASGKYTFALDDTYTDYSQVEHIFLLDNGATVADLLTENYLFDTEVGTFNSRFELVIVMKGAATPTSLLNGLHHNTWANPQKVVYDEHLYIIHPNGKVYDGVGKNLNTLK